MGCWSVWVSCMQVGQYLKMDVLVNKLLKNRTVVQVKLTQIINYLELHQLFSKYLICSAIFNVLLLLFPVPLFSKPEVQCNFTYPSM
jgi:hypothetical protein